MPQKFSHIVLGLGATGMSVVRYLCEQGIVPLVMDSRRNPPGIEQLKNELPQVALQCGGFDCRQLVQANQIIISPGISVNTPEVKAAADMGIEVIGDVELFARAIQEQGAKVLAITGSNGKSTVTTLVGEMAKAEGLNVAVGGNIGIPVLSLLKQRADLYVLELSSFQLETTRSLNCTAATCLNVSEDHMDRYDDFRAYREAKLSLYQQTQKVIFNRDDELTKPHIDVATNSFGLSKPEADDWGVSDGMICHGEDTVMPLLDVKLIGQHNQTNIVAAMALTAAAGVSAKAMKEVAMTFGGLSHRCEVVSVTNGVTYVNDSKATNVGATVAALEGLSNYPGNVILIAGGDSKGADFTCMADAMEAVDYLITLGRDGDKVAALKPDSITVNSMQSAVKKASKLAEDGDMVLLSPACASIDMYDNFMKRGQDFCLAVESLDGK
ncbi:UDP-N-acetylmuramoyl-L-alanine--D-glutamate ligase [Shewanella gelidii]|uniref:UDP-N-acetylmuramoylalanine--D-glutamate ligase n=1 Tax=Shewanella gelidii TaxID=1642821 RepID=A0A917JTD6_9GAMM|nr:UDP-N-acetylmuramoyl-L-alanine--D-glutamate ligase [Shewanella gelidii]MCL1098378.1 UDP-N-acetylmuramoyl-L-alanine--D-glutamate ligase [Shewanella gelidii]GGI83174.1 UDP-N-acetylmuramoylalanine--D-glutamate ligase [Shewanella gelidii]